MRTVSLLTQPVSAGHSYLLRYTKWPWFPCPHKCWIFAGSPLDRMSRNPLNSSYVSFSSYGEAAGLDSCIFFTSYGFVRSTTSRPVSTLHFMGMFCCSELRLKWGTHSRNRSRPWAQCSNNLPKLPQFTVLPSVWFSGSYLSMHWSHSSISFISTCPLSLTRLLDMEYLEVLTEGLERCVLVRGSGREVITIFS